MMSNSKLKAQFKDPGAEFTMMPFWFLNDRLCRPELIRQMDDFQRKGIDGFVIHPRMGLPADYEYLGDSFMADIRFIVEEAARRKMKVVIYDEAMYPSGSAHGMVVSGNPEYAAHCLRKVVLDASEAVDLQSVLAEGEKIEAAFYVNQPVKEEALTGEIIEIDCGSGSLTVPDKNGSVLLLVSSFSHGTIRGVHFGEDDREEGAPAASDLLNPDAVKKFIHVTYDRYYDYVGGYFGNTVIAMFTDEPSLLGRCANSKTAKPWTPGFLSYYESQGNRGRDLLSLWYDTGSDTQLKRQCYEDAVSRKLGESYYGQLSSWCAEHKIALTGHPAKSFDIGFERYFQIPGQDVVWRAVQPGGENGVEGGDSTLAKCSSDSARHFGRSRNANECFGCCGPKKSQWEFTADDMKWYMDWLFVRGVNLLYPHAFLYSARGEKRLNERPPDVGPNNLWWKYFNIFSAYAKRMCWLNTGCVNQARIAVVCAANSMPWRVAKPMQQNQYEFNYLEQSLLGEKCSLCGNKIRIEKQSYSAAVVEDEQALSSAAIEFLSAFARAGGCLIVYAPVGRQNTGRLKNAVYIGSSEEILCVLDGKVSKDVYADGCTGLRVSRIQKDGEDFILFVNEGEEPIEKDVRLRASGGLEAWNAMDGSIAPLPAIDAGGGCLEFALSLRRRESVIIHVDSAGKASGHLRQAPRIKQIAELVDGWSVRFENGEQRPLPCLLSWTRLSTMEHYSGEGVYENNKTIAIPEDAEKIILDLGSVHEMAEVFINGRRAGVKMWAPYRFDITEQAQKEIKSVKVIVTNSIANRISGTSLESGMLGPAAVSVYY